MSSTAVLEKVLMITLSNIFFHLSEGFEDLRDGLLTKNRKGIGGDDPG